MNIWSTQEEAARLKERFKNVNRAAFARAHNFKGGQAMIYQHITGRRPMSLEAALTYAAGFGCPLDEISPRLAFELQRAAALPVTPELHGSLREPNPGPSSVRDVARYFRRVDWAKFAKLTPAQQEAIEDWVIQQIEGFQSPAPTKSPAGARKKA